MNSSSENEEREQREKGLAMNGFSEDDRLATFLRQHRPTPPPAAANLEDRIMAIVQIPQSEPLPRRQHTKRRTLWLLPSAIAAGLVAIVGYQQLMPRQPSEAELAELETFIESTWQGTVAEQPISETEEVLPIADDAAVN